MSSSSIEAIGLHSEVVSGDVCDGNVAVSGFDDRLYVPASETPAKEPENGGSGGNDGFEEESFGRERDSVSMEVDFAGENDSRTVLIGPEAVVDGGTTSLEAERVSLNVEGNGGGVDDSGMVLGESRGVIDGGVVESGSNVCGVLEKSVGKAENNSDSKGSVEEDQLVQEPLNDDEFGGEVEAAGNTQLLPFAEKTVDVKVVGVSYSVGDNEAVGNEITSAMSTEESDGIKVKGGVSEPKVVDVVVALDERAGKDGENRPKKAKFCASDLVWGKVRSHPWWPGQIFEPGDASDKARKHFRPNSYLVAYFGDHTFAWNDKAKLKPFVPHFSQMVKQTSMEAFRHAVDCALDEVSRRVEFGLSCRCINDDVYSELKTQAIENAGVQEQQIVHEHADRCFAASSFEPVGLLDYISSLALEPNAEVDKLEHVMVRGCVSAFYRWKGYYYLPEFGPLIGYVNNEADAPVTDKKDEKCEVIDHQKVAEGTPEEHSSRPLKRKNLPGNDSRPAKQEKCLSDMMLKRGAYKVEGDEKTEGKADRKSISSASSSRRAAKSFSSKRKASKSSHKGLKTENSGLQSERTTPTASNDLKPSFRVGESILRVAGQLSKPSPLLKLDVLCHGKAAKAKGGRKQTTRQTKLSRKMTSHESMKNQGLEV